MAHKKQRFFEKNDNFKKPQLNLKRETRIGVAVVVFLLLAVIFLLSLSGLAGALGDITNKVLRLAFGWMAYGIPMVFVLIASALLKQPREDEHSTVSTHAYVGGVFIILSLTSFLHLLAMGDAADKAFEIAKSGSGGGYLGVIISYFLLKLTGYLASMIVVVAGIIIAFSVTFNVSFIHLIKRFRTAGKQPNGTPIQINGEPSVQGFVNMPVGEQNKALKREKLETKVNNISDKIGNFKVNVVKEDKNWKFPSLDLLDDAKTKVDSGNIEANITVIKNTLADFGIEVEMGEVNVGPTVTQYTFRPAIGVKLAQIAALQNDLALALAASPVRMELPIPGKALVGIEVPNKQSSLVRIKEILGTPDFVTHTSKLAFALGRDVAGHPVLSDLAKMPHLLIAGATGSGKSVCVNSILISLIYRTTPSEVGFIIIDPKRVELSLYNDVPHLLTPVVTDHKKAVNALAWAVNEMDTRYKLLSEVHKRNINEYNNAIPEKPLPYIVIVIDELADLMAVAQKEVEAAIVRLAQMARAVGIHLVVATQRPSVDVITGLIKANITSRIAFAVASQVDSRTILDNAGAEKLLGSGDMLYVTAELSKPRRIQGTFVTEKEIKRVTEFLHSQVGNIIFNEEILERPKHTVGIPGFSMGSGNGDEDDRLEEAVELIRSAGKASASLLQRRMQVGYARAARILDILEQKGIIGPAHGAKPREVYGFAPQNDDDGLSDEVRDFEENQTNSDYR